MVDVSEVKGDLIREMTEVLTSFCARLDGRRAAKHQAAQGDQGDPRMSHENG